MSEINESCDISVLIFFDFWRSSLNAKSITLFCKKHFTQLIKLINIFNLINILTSCLNATWSKTSLTSRSRQISVFSWLFNRKQSAHYWRQRSIEAYDISNRLTSYRAQSYDQNKFSFDSITLQMTASQVKNRKVKFFALTQIKIGGETRVHQRRRKNHQFRQWFDWQIKEQTHMKRTSHQSTLKQHRRLRIDAKIEIKLFCVWRLYRKQRCFKVQHFLSNHYLFYLFLMCKTISWDQSLLFWAR